MTGGEMAIVIAGTREDWPRGARTLTPHDPTREAERADPLVRGRARSRRQPGVVPDRRRTAIGRMPEKTPRGPRRPPHRRPHRSGSRRTGRSSPSINRFEVRVWRCPATRGSNVCGGEDGFPRPDPSRRVRARAPDRRPPAASPRPRLPPNTRRAYCRGAPAASTPGSTAGPLEDASPRRLPRRAPRPGESPGKRLDGGGRGVLPGPPRP